MQQRWPTLYVSGDNASVDVAVLFVGAADVGRFGHDNVTLGSAEAAAVADLLGDAVVLPVHAQDWAHFTEPLSAFEAAYPGKLVVLPRGIEVRV